MSDIALTNIVHGNEDGSVTRIEYGESVDALPDDVRKQLKDEGLIGDEPMANSEAMTQIEVLKSQIEGLKAQIAESQSRFNAALSVEPVEPADKEPADKAPQDKAPIKK